MPKQSQKGFAQILVLVILVGALALGAGLIVYGQRLITVSPADTNVAKTLVPSITHAPTPTTQATASPSAMPGWKTYTSTKLDVAINYPGSWEVNEQNDRNYVAFAPHFCIAGCMDPRIDIAILPNPSHKSVQQWFEDESSKDGDPSNVIAGTTRDVRTYNGLTGYFVQTRRDYTSIPFTEFYVSDGDNVISVGESIYTVDSPEYTTYLQMLSTLRLLH